MAGHSNKLGRTKLGRTPANTAAQDAEQSNQATASEDDESMSDQPDDYLEWVSRAGHHIENNLQDKRWAALVTAAQPRCLSLTDAVGEHQALARLSLSVLWTDDIEMARLNSFFRSRSQPTNILSFPAAAGVIASAQDVFLGDLVLSYDIIIDEAHRAERPPVDHLSHLFVHGLLHLTGHDHKTDREAEQMEALETQLLAAQNIPDPYQEITG